MRTLAIGVLASLGTITAAAAAELSVDMKLINPQGIGAAMGSVTVKDSESGAVFTPALKGLTPGLHGFHVHENPACGPGEKDGKVIAGGAAGSHYDPAKTGKHEGPDGNGHLGDLPVLEVDADGTATKPVTARRVKVADLQGRALMVHAGPDDYAKNHGGDRIACGML